MQRVRLPMAGGGLDAHSGPKTPGLLPICTVPVRVAKWRKTEAWRRVRQASDVCPVIARWRL
ncbi:hypothetical protein CUR21_00035 [Pseudorhodobacter sp. MZDSW-24AT]|nr:hypothetical protein CUR21_00035 [Pseudorhodobacter sp. MZDSW-24AT]